VDLVLPSDSSVAMLLPAIVRVLGEPPAQTPRSYVLTLPGGEALGPEQTLGSAEVDDGTTVRVSRVADAPPAAIVHDVTDEVADDLANRRGRWGPVALRRSATAVGVGAAAAAAAAAGPVVASGVLVVVAALLMVAGVVAGVLRQAALGVAVVGCGAAVAFAALPHVFRGLSDRSALGVVIAAAAIVAWGAVTRMQRAAFVGAGMAIVFLGMWAILALTHVSSVRTAALVAVVSVAALGMLPRVAMLTSGLTRLDDQLVLGRQVRTMAVAAAIDTAHRGLALATVASGAAAVAAGGVLATGATAWAVVLAGLTAAALLLRARTYPLVVQVVVLVAGALAILGCLGLRWLETAQTPRLGVVAVIAAVGVLACMVLVVNPPQHVRARFRLVADRVEAGVVIAMIPVAVGVFEVYPRLLGAAK